MPGPFISSRLIIPHSFLICLGKRSRLYIPLKCLIPSFFTYSIKSKFDNGLITKWSPEWELSWMGCFFPISNPFLWAFFFNPHSYWVFPTTNKGRWENRISLSICGWWNINISRITRNISRIALNSFDFCPSESVTPYSI